MEDKEKQPEIITVYGFTGNMAGQIAFQTQEEANKYNKLYYNGKLIVDEMKIYKSVEVFEKDEPTDFLTRLCKEKGELLNSIQLPFVKTLTSSDSSHKYESKLCSFYDLREILKQVDEKLKEKYSSFGEVDENEVLAVTDTKGWKVELPVKKYRILCDIFMGVCQKINNLNAQIRPLLIKENYNHSEYKALQRNAFIRSEFQNENPISYKFEMLDRGNAYEKDYLELE